MRAEWARRTAGWTVKRSTSTSVAGRVPKPRTADCAAHRPESVCQSEAFGNEPVTSVQHRFQLGEPLFHPDGQSTSSRPFKNHQGTVTHLDRVDRGNRRLQCFSVAGAISRHQLFTRARQMQQTCPTLEHPDIAVGRGWRGCRNAVHARATFKKAETPLGWFRGTTATRSELTFPRGNDDSVR
jgi:hypothetical protein